MIKGVHGKIYKRSLGNFSAFDEFLKKSLERFLMQPIGYFFCKNPRKISEETLSGILKASPEEILRMSFWKIF